VLFGDTTLLNVEPFCRSLFFFLSRIQTASDKAAYFFFLATTRDLFCANLTDFPAFIDLDSKA